MYISFLRAINVGGKNKIAMVELKKVYETIGFKQVKTYLNTGNIIFDADQSTDEIKRLIQVGIEKQFDLQIEIILRSFEELDQLITEYPFGDEGKNRYVTMFDSACTEMDSDKVNHIKKEADQVMCLNKEIFLKVPEGYGKSKLTNQFFEKLTGQFATTRNMNTINKLYKMMETIQKS